MPISKVLGSYVANLYIQCINLCSIYHYCENISEWSDPILKALEECLGNDESAFVVDIELYYFNSSSAKFLFDFFEFLEESAEGGKSITVNWRYRAEDDTMQEAGEDFEEDVSACSYNMVMVEQA